MCAYENWQWYCALSDNLYLSFSPSLSLSLSLSLKAPLICQLHCFAFKAPVHLLRSNWKSWYNPYQSSWTNNKSCFLMYVGNSNTEIEKEREGWFIAAGDRSWLCAPLINSSEWTSRVTAHTHTANDHSHFYAIMHWNNAFVLYNNVHNWLSFFLTAFQKNVAASALFKRTVLLFRPSIIS